MADGPVRLPHQLGSSGQLIVRGKFNFKSVRGQGMGVGEVGRRWQLRRAGGPMRVAEGAVEESG